MQYVFNLDFVCHRKDFLLTDELEFKLISINCFSPWDVCCMHCVSTSLRLRQCMSVEIVWLWLLSVAMLRYQTVTHIHRFAINVFCIKTRYT